jgi:hypothetical protein
MLVAIGAVLAVVGWVLMTYTSYSPAMAFVGGGLSVFMAIIYDDKGKPARFDVNHAVASEIQTLTSL